MEAVGRSETSNIEESNFKKGFCHFLVIVPDCYCEFVNLIEQKSKKLVRAHTRCTVNV